MKCKMCKRQLRRHPRCLKCEILLEKKETRKTLCRCGRYHNSPSAADPRYCASCMDEPPHLGEPKEAIIEAEE